MNAKLTAKMTEVLLYIAATPAQRENLPHPGRATNTCAALVTRGLITPGMNLWDHELTDFGREALAEAAHLVLHVEPATQTLAPLDIPAAVRAYIEAEWRGAALVMDDKCDEIMAALMAADPNLSHTAAAFRFHNLVAEMRGNGELSAETLVRIKPVTDTTVESLAVLAVIDAEATRRETAEPTFMPCPRRCGVDVRNHHSSGSVNGGCDTGPMSMADMHDWFAARGVGQLSYPMADAIAEHYGKTEDELNEVYDAMHGPVA